MTQPTSGLNAELRGVLDRINDQAFELAYIKNSSTYRLATSLRKSPLTSLGRARPHTLTVRALGRSGPGSKGCEVWLLRASARRGEPGVPWDFVHRSGFAFEPSRFSSHGRCLRSTGGEARFAAGPEPELVFQTFPWGGLAEIEFAGRREVIDLYSETTGTVLVWPASSPMQGVSTPLPAAASPPAPATVAAPEPGTDQAEAFTEADRAFLVDVARTKATTVAVHCPRWLGISSATRALFETCYCVPERREIEPSLLSDAALDRHARVLAESGVRTVIISGGDHAHRRLVLKLKALRPDLRIDVLWHGSYVQVQDDYEWAALRSWIDAARAGIIRGIATVKAGMEEFFRSQGVASCLLLNYVPGEPMSPPDLPTECIEAGVWISGVSFRKCPHAAIAGLAMLRNARLHAAGMDERARDFAKYLGLPAAEMHESPLPHGLLMEAIRRTHLTLYVTFSECCPMLPLESLRMGVPCLLGPVSHLFQDAPYLFERLVVPFPDRAEVIARAARRAFEERDAIMRAYAAYAAEYNRLARARVDEFVTHGPTPADRPA